MQGYKPLLRTEDIPGVDATDRELFEFAMTIDGYRAEGSFGACMVVRDRVASFLATNQLELASTLELRVYLFGTARGCRHADSDLPRAKFDAVLSELRSRIPPDHSPPRSAEQFVFDAFTFGLDRHERLLATLVPRIAPETGIVAAAMDGLLSFDTAVVLEGRIDGTSRIDLIVKSGEWNPIACEFKVLWPNGLKECLDKARRDFEKLSSVGGLVVIFAYSVVAAPEAHGGRLSQASLESATDASFLRFGEPQFRSGTRTIRDVREATAEWELLAWRVEKR
jgi:hypothetical protein